MEQPVANIETAKKLGLLESEYQQIIDNLGGREPNFTELSIYSVMWSEHCSYKNSIKYLKTLPRTGPHLLAEAGEENAGLVDIGDDLACAFKIESHNHPSAIEPYQGAATGVGGINRDIFTMGARPIAQLNSLRFGESHLDKTKWILKGVVKGIGDYGNSFGVPVLGGEVFFDKSYNTNPLVNAMSVGIVKKGKTISATAEGVGNPVFIVGSSTGKDGIHGATFASGDLSDSSMDDLPAVQVGDPFQEKLLLEASLELAETDFIVGMQDMGAAGITCSTSEMSEKGGVGMDIYLDKVPTRQEGMQPFEILLSESQERMLVVVKKGFEQQVIDIFKKWDLNCVEIGEVTEGNTLNYFFNGELVATVPADTLVLGGGAPVYDREFREPAYFQQAKEFNIDSVNVPDNLIKVTHFLLKQPNIASKKWIIQQYDSMVGTINMSTNNPSDAGIVNIKDSNKAIAVTVDCNARFVHADPEEGCAMAVAEAARNIVCSGGELSAVTNCCNFGNPYNPEAYWQFVKAIKGMGKACEKFSTPVTGGNVSFYNQTITPNGDVPVMPTPTIGMIGLIDDKSKITGLGFENEGDVIVLIGKSKNNISSSEYLRYYHDCELSPSPDFDIEEEYQLQATVKALISNKLVNSAHDCSDGGLMITLLESSFVFNKGFKINSTSGIRKDAFLFGESPSRIIISVSPEKIDDVKQIFKSQGQSFEVLGVITGSEAVVDGVSHGKIDTLFNIYDNALEKVILN